jgi:RNA polymerase sigma factor (sigma-70 family)
LAELGDREKDILTRRSEGYSLEELGGAYGICRERVRQIERRAKQKIRDTHEK